jgi:hypothetical protein
MTDEPMHRDAELREALGDVVAGPNDELVDWVELRRSINQRAASELGRRRVRYGRMRFAIPAALAASLALFLLVSRADRTGGEALVGPSGTGAGTRATIDELLDANLSDGQFRALLFGATEADDLLLSAAEEDDRP